MVQRCSTPDPAPPEWEGKRIQDSPYKKAFKYRLYPTKPQRQDLEKVLSLCRSLCRQLYNAALQERRDAYRKAQKPISAHEQMGYLPQIRAELPEYKGVHSQVLQDVIQKVDRAFQGFFRRV
ncbi:helix-turn-helix domain-containing protein, partial [Thermus altitudinis]|uniref:helix-turn-helix domain-containing protein n=1 Tax=Thermus altitudinis TaxID=2908145 RepID=UPI001FAA5829